MVTTGSEMRIENYAICSNHVTKTLFTDGHLPALLKSPQPATSRHSNAKTTREHTESQAMEKFICLETPASAASHLPRRLQD